MRHYAGELCLILRGFDRAPIDVDKSARQRKSINRGIIHALKLVGVLWTWSLRGQHLPERVEVFVNARLIAHAQLMRDFSRILLSQPNILRGRKHVEAGLHECEIGPPGPNDPAQEHSAGAPETKAH